MKICNFSLKCRGVRSWLWGFLCWKVGPKLWVALCITEDITVLDLFPLLVSLHIWGDQLRNKKLLFTVDNQAVVHIINFMTSKSERVMTVLRAFTLPCLHLNVVVKAQYVNSSSNKVADALSRFKFQKFHQLVPDTEPLPTPVPSHPWNIFS